MDPATLTVSFVVDLPSKGDTCFPGLIRLNESEVRVYNYTTDLDAPEYPFIAGQLRPTSIYSLVLSFP